jgi:hypothetical protein
MPVSKLSLRWYAVCVGIAAGLYWIGTWPLVMPTYFPTVFIYAPLPVGIWLGLKRRGRPYGVYALTSAVVGILALGGVIGESLGDNDTQWNWAYAIITYTVGPALLFMAGTLFGDAVKHRAWPQSYAELANVPDRANASQGLTVRQTFVLAIVVALIPAIAQMSVPVIEALLDSGP